MSDEKWQLMLINELRVEGKKGTPEGMYEEVNNSGRGERGMQRS